MNRTMSTIIRATDRNRGTHGVAYNFEDMAGKAQAYLDEIRAEAGRIVAKAHEEAKAIRREAEKQGRQAAMEAVEGMVQKQVAPVLPALVQAAEQIDHARQAWLKHWETAAVHLAAKMAERIVRQQLPELPDVTPRLVREALELAAGSDRVRIYLNSQDCEAIRGQVEAMATALGKLGDAEVVPDPRISRGGCRIETRLGTIDQQFESQLARIEEELTS